MIDTIILIALALGLAVVGYSMYRGIEAHFAVKQALFDADVIWAQYLASIQKRHR